MVGAAKTASSSSSSSGREHTQSPAFPPSLRSLDRRLFSSRCRRHLRREERERGKPSPASIAFKKRVGGGRGRRRRRERRRLLCSVCAKKERERRPRNHPQEKQMHGVEFHTGKGRKMTQRERIKRRRHQALMINTFDYAQIAVRRESAHHRIRGGGGFAADAKHANQICITHRQKSPDGGRKICPKKALPLSFKGLFYGQQRGFSGCVGCAMPDIPRTHMHTPHEAAGEREEEKE